MTKTVSALVLTGYGLNCDYETDYALKKTGAQSRRVHINQLIHGSVSLSEFQILVFIGGFSWADDHGAGVVLATRIKNNIGNDLRRFFEDGKLIIGICNGFQTIVNLGILPGLNGNYDNRQVALITNHCGNFRNQWVTLGISPDSPCVFTRNMTAIDLPVRHAEGKFFADNQTLQDLEQNHLIVARYANEDGKPANGAFPLNPNGSLKDIAGICDPTGRIFGLMPHPEAYNNCTNHPGWFRDRELLQRQRKLPAGTGGDGLRMFDNAVRYIREEW
jgi:phosphoribosylformylglycinamidine synthase I